MLLELSKKIQTVSSNIFSIACIILAAIGAFFLLTRSKKNNNNNKIQINFAELEAKQKARERHDKVKNNGGCNIDNDTANMVD